MTDRSLHRQSWFCRTHSCHVWGHNPGESTLASLPPEPCGLIGAWFCLARCLLPTTAWELVSELYHFCIHCLSSEWRNVTVVHSWFCSPCVLLCLLSFLFCLQCFNTVRWALGRSFGLYKIEWWDAGIAISQERGADALNAVQLMPPPLRHLLLH